MVLHGSAVCRQEEQLPFLEAAWRAVACAVKDAGLAFIGAHRRSLTGEARECAQGFRQEGQGKKLARERIQSLKAEESNGVNIASNDRGFEGMGRSRNSHLKKRSFAASLSKRFHGKPVPRTPTKPEGRGFDPHRPYHKPRSATPSLRCSRSFRHSEIPPRSFSSGPAPARSRQTRKRWRDWWPPERNSRRR